MNLSKYGQLYLLHHQRRPYTTTCVYAVKKKRVKIKYLKNKKLLQKKKLSRPTHKIWFKVIANKKSVHNKLKLEYTNKNRLLKGKNETGLW